MNDIDIEDYHRNILQELNAVEEEGEISLSIFLNDLIDIDIESNFNFSYQVVSRVMQICVNSLNSNLITLADACMHFMRYSICRCVKLEEEINESFFDSINTIVKICLNMRYFIDNRSLLFQRAFLSLIIELDKSFPEFMILWKGYKTEMCTFLTSLLHLISFHLTLLNDLLKEFKKDEKLNCNRYMHVGCSRIKIIEIAFNLLLKMFKEIREIPFISSLIDYVNLIVDTYDHIPDVEIKKKILSLCKCLYSSNQDGSRTHLASVPELTNLLGRKRNNYLALTKEKDINMSYLRNCSYIYVSESHLSISTFSATDGEQTNVTNGSTTHTNHGDASTEQSDGVSASIPKNKVVLTPNGFKGCLLLNFFYAYFYNTQNKLLIVLCYNQVKVRKDPGGKMLIFRCSRMDALGALSNKLRTQYEGRLLDHIDICVKFRSESIKNKMFDVISEVISIESKEPENGKEMKDESDEIRLREGVPHETKLKGENKRANSSDDDDSDSRTYCVSGDEINEEEKLKRRKVSFASMKEICLMDYRTSMGTKTLLLDESLNEMDRQDDEGVSDLTDEQDKKIPIAPEEATRCPSVDTANSLGGLHTEEEDMIHTDGVSEVGGVMEVDGTLDPKGEESGESHGGMLTKVSYATTKDLEHAYDVEGEGVILEDDDLFAENPLCCVLSEHGKNLGEGSKLANVKQIHQLKCSKGVKEVNGSENPLNELFILSDINKMCEQVSIGKRSQEVENDDDDDRVNVGNHLEEGNDQASINIHPICFTDDEKKLLLIDPSTKLDKGKENSRRKNKSDGSYFPQRSYSHGNIPQGMEKQKVENCPPYDIKEFMIKNGIEEDIAEEGDPGCDALGSFLTTDLWKGRNNKVGNSTLKSPPEIVKQLLNYSANQKPDDENIQSLAKAQVNDTLGVTQREDLQGNLRRIDHRVLYNREEGDRTRQRVKEEETDNISSCIIQDGRGYRGGVAVNLDERDTLTDEKSPVGECRGRKGHDERGTGEYSQVVNIEGEDEASNEMILRDNPMGGEMNSVENSTIIRGGSSCREHPFGNESSRIRVKSAVKEIHHIDKPSSSCKSKKRIATNEINRGNEISCTMNEYTAKNSHPDSPYPVKKSKYNYHDPKLLNLLKNEENLDKLSAKYLIKAYTIIQYNRRNTHIQIADCFRSVRKEITTSFECINSKYVAWLKELQQKFSGRLERIVSRHSYMLLINKRRTRQINIETLPTPIDLQIISTKMNTLQDTLNIVQRTMEDKIKNMQILMAYKESDVYTSSLSLNTLLSRCSTQRLREGVGDKQGGGTEQSGGEM
ncbi:conserved Plasmodium protein, unknown function [Plasmodium knowlesi strain H]|uniref:Uncharacterized protein n=3 Tax=Plasmodium knowlesi TaxID=5850 RepID=A0A5K1UVD1_PLAKH|nr:conserved Plasmodium protein, unknown function [Plasmodium knowlesi strain H]OTN64934.1 Uncharacterized protein PKNOH_S120125000 [Plasmodium knowlesi]CAA9988116.1 conserved Plasmodium protein, unknown function [Plasmodium knowlesi strain H]SBO19992.1 conserved Plasmodium protein, unknown function [Plasmodium knowlesi strain H]SBO29119.1 conserved Plasmodium protein, unknown function [Plasmodium knowlesi strain H]VVS77590.1 conserved Plasmodium protein, unknown function [Plasmodium knowlesi |eukprot:XP_002259090.1 hypothetical protein, conserved in Plasmodium species [Plasmodium knowlesi strain H]